MVLAILFLVLAHCTQRRSIEPIPNVLEVDRDSLTYSVIAEGAAVPAQLIQVTSQTGSRLTYKVTHQQLWLDIFNHGVTPDTVFVYAGSRDLAQGIYQDTITISAPGAEGSPHDIAVTMTVFRGIKTIPKTLNLSLLIGSPQVNQETLIVAPTGGGSMYYQIDNPISWLSFSRLQGVARDTLLTSIRTTGLARGAYVRNFTITASQAANSPLTVPCSLSVESWGTQFFNTNFGLRGIRFLSPSIGIAVGFKRTVLGLDGYVFRTTDSGTTWTPRMITRGAALVGLVFLDAERGYAFGENGNLLVTHDAGASWNLFSAGTEGTVVDFAAPAPDTLYSVGDLGVLWCSFDGGMNWVRKVLPILLPMYSIQFLDGHRGWVAGRSGTILYTDDAGDTWQQAPSVTGADLRQILLIDSATGYVVGDSGVILSRVGGNKWVRQQPPLLVNLRRVHFADRQNGWAVGAVGTVFHTSDGGQSWRQQASETQLGLFGVWFLDSRHGWIAGDNGLIKTTYSGGDDR